MKNYMPKLFQPMVLCARSEVSRQGTCQGDSGSPLMMFDPNQDHFLQIGIVAGGITLDQCGVKNYPSLFTSLIHPKNHEFIKTTVEISGECKLFIMDDSYLNQRCKLVLYFLQNLNLHSTYQ